MIVLIGRIVPIKDIKTFIRAIFIAHTLGAAGAVVKIANPAEPASPAIGLLESEPRWLAALRVAFSRSR